MARLGLLRVAANEVRNVLLVEALDLKVQAQRLQNLDDEVRRLQEALQQAITARDEAITEERRSKALLDAAELDVAETEDRLDNAKRTVRNLSNQIAQLTEEANRPYLCPVSQVTWSECTDASHVKYKNEYVSKRDEKLKALAQARNRWEDASATVDRISDDLQWYRQQAREFAQNLETARLRLQEAEAQMKAARDLLTERARFAEEEKWKSRADVFLGENASDQKAIESAIGQLSAGP